MLPLLMNDGGLAIVSCRGWCALTERFRHAGRNGLREHSTFQALHNDLIEAPAQIGEQDVAVELEWAHRSQVQPHVAVITRGLCRAT